MKRLSAFQQQPLLQDLLLYPFQLYTKRKKLISISIPIPESALGIFRPRKTLLNHLAFCFSFSLKHLLVYFAVFECFSSSDALLSLSIPKLGPARGRATAVSIISMQMKSLHSRLLCS